MKNTLRLTAALIAAAMISTLTGCGQPKETPVADTATESAVDQTASTEENKDTEDTEEFGMPNPMVESTFKEIVELTGSTAIIPSYCEDPKYFIYNGEMGEVQFTTEEGYTNLSLRIKKADAFEDISGCEYEWIASFDELIGSCECKTYVYHDDDETTDDVRVCLWYDSENKIMYSLSTIAKDLNGFDEVAIALDIMRLQSFDNEFLNNAMEARAGKTSFESYDEIISLLIPTEAYALVKIKGYDGEVLMITDGVFDNCDGENMAAIDATLYTKKTNGEVTADTLIYTQGTAYPISVDKNGLIYCFGHHSIEESCYADNGTDDHALMIMKYIEVTEFDNEGYPTRVMGFYRDPDGFALDSYEYEETDVDSFNKAFDEFAESTPVNFTAMDGRTAAKLDN